MAIKNRLLSTLLRIDLVSELRKWRRRYKNSHYVFDSKIIYLSITKWNTGKCSISAAAFCDDPLAGGISSSNYITFYQRSNFESLEQASEYLIDEGKRASAVFPNMDIYLTQNKDEDHSKYLHIQGGNISETNYIDTSQPCIGCGVRFSGGTGSICPKCGEPRFY